MRRLNTNISALKINKQLSQTSDKLQQSIKRMGSGLRINKAADDASGIAIAYSLRSQILGIGQGIKNSNDALSVVQLVDGAMEECINIANTIKTKAIQAAQDGQTFESRKMLQRDIDKLLEDIDSISTSTSFNGQKLLSGNFSNKSFQAGGNAGETISFSVSSSETTQIGRITATDMYVTQEGPLSLDITGAFDGKVYNVVGPTFQYDNSKEHGMIALEKAINALSSKTGVQAKATVSTTSPTATTAGRIEDLEINGVFIGDLTVEENDQNGVLLKAINNKTIETGVQASINNEGKLILVSDGRALEMTGDVHEVLGYSGNVKTFGRMQLLSSGPVIPNIEQSNTTASSGVSTNSIYSSVTYSGQSPSSIEGEAEAAFEYAVSIWESVLDLSDVPLDIDVTFKDLGNDGVLGNASPADIHKNFTSIDLAFADVFYATPLANNISGVDQTTGADSADSADMIVNINNNNSIKWYFGTDGKPGLGEIDLVTVMLHEIGHGLGFISGYDNKIGDFFVLNEGDPFIFDTFLEDSSGNNFVNDMTSAERQTAATDENLWWSTNGAKMYAPLSYNPASSVSHYDEDTYTTGGDALMTPILNPGETIHSVGDIVLTAFSDMGYDLRSTVTFGQTQMYRASDIDVGTMEDAQIAIFIADEMQKNFDKIRANAGAVENQLTSTIANRSQTSVNLSMTKSTIEDLDFANETEVLQRMQILMQSGIFAMQQSNVTADSILSLLQ